VSEAAFNGRTHVCKELRKGAQDRLAVRRYRFRSVAAAISHCILKNPVARVAFISWYAESFLARHPQINRCGGRVNATVCARSTNELNHSCALGCPRWLTVFGAMVWRKHHKTYHRQPVRVGNRCVILARYGQFVRPIFVIQR
jgi:hypothetical protein